jgi:hypothetical protein
MRTAIPSFGMCQGKPPATQSTDTASKLIQQLDEEIKYEKENKPDSTEVLKNLEKNGWTVRNEGPMVELKKQSGDNTVYVIFNVRSPQAEKQEEVGETKQEGQ